jgi:CRISPR-associated protein Cas1
VESRASLRKYVTEVDEGDTANREALASRVYFRALFGPEFKRGRFRDIVNAGLNYGYAVLRGSIRKELVICGLEGSIGIFHDSAENPFNLSDDIIEPFRPFVDLIVLRSCASSGLEELTPDIKKELVGVLTREVRLDGKRYSLGGALVEVTRRVGSAIESNSVSGVVLPDMIMDEPTTSVH